MRLYVSRSGWLVPQRLFAVVAALVSAVLVVSTWSAPAVATEAPEQESSSEGDDQELLSRPDRLSAALLARSTGKRVEVESARTESSRSFVNPDGTTTVEASIGMQSIRGADGAWRDVDLSLVEADDGSLQPAASPADLTVGGGGSSLVARVGLGKSRSLSVTWPSELPAPSVDGAIATYKVSDAMDLLVISTQQGASVRFRINERPSAEDVALTLGLAAESVEVEEGTQNRLVNRPGSGGGRDFTEG